MKLYIKYMVSIRCKMVVRSALEEMGLGFALIELGEVNTKEDLTPNQLGRLKTILLKSGLELIDDKKAMLIERIKNVVIEMVHYADKLPKAKTSVYISKKLGNNYNHLSNVFSEVTGTTIEHFIIAHKIEKAKELLMYDELNLTEIAAKLHYSSVAHLSTQFKKVTGLTPSFFKTLRHKKRTGLENI